MNEPLFQVGAEGVDVDKLVAEIQAAVAEKKARGLYADPRIARAELQNLINMKDEKEFMRFFLDCLRESAFVDINDFAIVERRRWLSKPLVLLKTGIWKMLRFYTYRLWSQQNQINGLLLTAIENLDKQYRERIERLEKELAARRAESSAP